jgi:hypothetical protein
VPLPDVRLAPGAAAEPGGVPAPLAEAVALRRVGAKGVARLAADGQAVPGASGLHAAAPDVPVLRALDAQPQSLA